MEIQVQLCVFLVLLCNALLQLRINWQLVLRLSHSACTFFSNLQHILWHTRALLHWNSKEIVKTSNGLLMSERLWVSWTQNWTRFWKILSSCNKVCSCFALSQLLLDFFLNFQTAVSLSLSVSLSRRLRSRARASSTNYQAQNCYTIAIEAADRLNNRRFWTLSFEKLENKIEIEI